MTVKKRKDNEFPKYLTHKIADIRGGVSVVSSELNVDFLQEGTPLSAPVEGKSHVVKFALVQTNANTSATKVRVYKGHNFKVDDIVCAVEGGAAYAITAIATANVGYDELTLGTTLGVELTKDVSYLFHAAASGANNAALKYEPIALVGTGKPVMAGVNIDTDAWCIGVTKGLKLPALIASKLKGIINY